MQETLLQPKRAPHPELKEPARFSIRRLTAGLTGAAKLAAFLVAGILALEAFFNFAGVGNEEFLKPDATLGVVHIPGKKVVWRLEGYSDEYLSTQGLRDTWHNPVKAPGTYRIALLGDSAVEGMQVALKDTYGKKLEALLNSSGRLPGPVEVINFGCSSYSNGQEAIQLEKQVLPFQPDLVILMYNLGDYIENIRDPNTLNAEPRPYFYFDDQGRLVQDNTIMDFNRKAFQPNPPFDFLRNNSRIYGVLTHMNLALSLNEPLYTKMRNSFLKLLPGSKAQWKHVQAPYTIHDPWKVTEALISRTATDCKKMDAKFMLLCMPNNLQEKEYARQIQSLAKLARSTGFTFLDLTPDCLNHKNPKSLFLRYHLSAAGHELAARRIAETMP
jgi:lysophospholipase L1-like esterase